ncbi:helix-turn-helix domain-containing protein, partial [Proteus mirabilis]|uniref:helix-turn-helix domain-containing protein n=1 Tax=Proteus mirabilis TaxID=584 RepID=UPI003315D9D2
KLTASVATIALHTIQIKGVNESEVAIENYEKEILLDKQQELKGDINAMAEQLSISKRALIYKLKKYGV